MEKTINLENLSVKDLRKRLFIKKSVETFKHKDYTFIDNVPEQVEKIKGFKTWETFGETWDIYWAGLDVSSNKWIAGRHHSPLRILVLPLRIIEIDERSGRMLETHLDKSDLKEIDMPIGQYSETEEDRIISESLSGKVTIDEPDEDKAERLIEKTIADLEQKLEMIKGLKV